MLSSVRAWTSVTLTRKRDSRRTTTTTTTGFRENVVVVETRYQLLEVLSFCKQQIKTNVLTFVMKKGEMKLSGLSIFFGNTRKSISSSNLKVSVYDLPIVISEFQFHLKFKIRFSRSLASNTSVHWADSVFPIFTLKDNYREVLWSFNFWDCKWNEFLMFPFKSNILEEVGGLLHEVIFSLKSLLLLFLRGSEGRCPRLHEQVLA